MEGNRNGIDCEKCRAGDPPTNWRPGANYIPDTNSDRLNKLSNDEKSKILAALFSAVERKPNAENYIKEWLCDPIKED